MSDRAASIFEVTTRLKRRDLTLKEIDLFYEQFTDSDLIELTDCLLVHPNVVTDVHLGYNNPTDETGIKLAQYVASSSTIKHLSLFSNCFDLATAEALQFNSSLRELLMNTNRAVDRSRVEAAFVKSLRLNPHRSSFSIWYLCSCVNYFKRLKDTADELGHPTFQMILNHELEKNETKTVKHIL